MTQNPDLASMGKEPTLNQSDYGLVEPLTLLAHGCSPEPGTAPAATPDDYDNYFRIRRDGTHEDWANSAFFVTQQIVADLPRTTLSEGIQRDLLNGVALVLMATSGTRTQSASVPPTLSRSSTPTEVAAFRWKVGHQLFHLVLSIINTQLDRACKGVEHEDWARVSSSFDSLTVLLASATATMHYTSDFPRANYENLIRPSMEPPWMPPGFSGVFNAEHGIFEKRLKDLKRNMRDAEPPSDTRELYAQLRKEQSRNRREHRLICEKFVPGGDSLLKQHFSAKSDS